MRLSWLAEQLQAFESWLKSVPCTWQGLQTSLDLAQQQHKPSPQQETGGGKNPNRRDVELWGVHSGHVSPGITQI